jgi:hypothetical protein
MELHFLYDMLNCQTCDQSYIAFSLSCKLSQPSLACNTVYNFKSSAYSLQVHLLSSNNCVMSFTNNTNKSGPTQHSGSSKDVSSIQDRSIVHFVTTLNRLGKRRITRKYRVQGTIKLLFNRQHINDKIRTSKKWYTKIFTLIDPCNFVFSNKH